MALELFPRCVLPGCVNPVDTQGKPCGECRTILGDMLSHHPGGVPLTAQEQRDRDAGTLAAYKARLLTDPDPLRRRSARTHAAEAGEIPKQNQRCWLCEERRLCTKIAGRWECRDCQQITRPAAGAGIGTAPRGPCSVVRSVGSAALRRRTGGSQLGGWSPNTRARRPILPDRGPVPSTHADRLPPVLRCAAPVRSNQFRNPHSLRSHRNWLPARSTLRG